MFTAVEYVKENLVYALDNEVHKISDALIKQNLEAYRELAKWLSLSQKTTVISSKNYGRIFIF